LLLGVCSGCSGKSASGAEAGFSRAEVNAAADSGSATTTPDAPGQDAPLADDTQTVTVPSPDASAAVFDSGGARADANAVADLGPPSSPLAALTSCQLSRDPASLATTCANVPPPAGVAQPALYDGTAATRYASPFGAEYFRITLPKGLTDSAVQQMAPDYSKVAVWNADGTRLWLYSQNGFLQLFDGKTYQYIEELTPERGWAYSGQDDEPRWSNTDPNIIYYVSMMNFNSYNIQTHTTTTLHSFTQSEIGMTCANIHNGDEGNSDDSDRYWAFYCINGAYEHQGMLVYDRQTNSVISHKGLGAGGMCGASACPTNFNWVGLSHSGKHVLVNWNIDANDNDLTTRGLGQEVFDRNLNYMSKSSEKNWHCDLVQLADGTDVFVGAAHLGDTNGYHAVRAVRLDDGVVATSCMLPGSQGYHISGRSHRKSWILYSTYDTEEVVAAGVFASEVFAINMDTCEVGRIAHAQSFWGDGSNGYSSEPHASMNFDFTKAVWGSNWQVQNGVVQTYVAEW
jgi:hypothetical protein